MSAIEEKVRSPREKNSASTVLMIRDKGNETLVEVGAKQIKQFKPKKILSVTEQAYIDARRRRRRKLRMAADKMAYKYLRYELD